MSIEFYGVVVMTAREYARLKEAEQALMEPSETPAAPAVDTSGGLEPPTYKELYEGEQKRARQVEQALDGLQGQFDEERRERAGDNTRWAARYDALYRHVEAVLQDNTSIRAARASHSLWLENEGRERLNAPRPLVSSTSDT